MAERELVEEAGGCAIWKVLRKPREKVLDVDFLVTDPTSPDGILFTTEAKAREWFDEVRRQRPAAN